MTSVTILRCVSAFPTARLLFAPFANSLTSQIAATAGSAQHSTPEQLVDALNGVFGKQKPDALAVHAKGVDLTGVFRPSDAASSVSKAPHLQKTSVPFTVRFSNFPG
jgi:catalase